MKRLVLLRTVFGLESKHYTYVKENLKTKTIIIPICKDITKITKVISLIIYV